MELITAQRVLARLLTDEPLREELATDPADAAARLRVPQPELLALCALRNRELDFAARGLLAKRREAAFHCLPTLSAHLGDDGRTLFRRYARSHPSPHGPRKHAADALAFARWLRRECADSRATSQLARWEAARISVSAGFARAGLAALTGIPSPSGPPPGLYFWIRPFFRLRLLRLPLPQRPRASGLPSATRP